MTTTAWATLGIVNLPVYFLLGWLWFKDWDTFRECVVFWITPDFVSLFRGEYWDDRWSEMKLWVWLVCCSSCVYAEGYLIETYWLN